MPSLFRSPVMLSALVFLAFPITQGAAVEVEVSAAKIARRTFDPQSPPPEMPKLTPPEAALCEFRFACQVESRVEGRQSIIGATPGKVTSLRFTTQLAVTVWLPENGTEKLSNHEEAHRQICEYYYATARATAEAIGKKHEGTKLKATLTQKEALQKELNQLQQRLIDDFMHQVGDRCAYAQDQFDAITEHGINPIAEQTAIEQAIEMEKKSPDSAIPKLSPQERDGAARGSSGFRSE